MTTTSPFKRVYREVQKDIYEVTYRNLSPEFTASYTFIVIAASMTEAKEIGQSVCENYNLEFCGINYGVVFKSIKS